MKGEEGAAPVLTAEGGCRGWEKTLWRGGQMLVSQEPAVASCRRWRGLAWATEERAGKSCGSSGRGRESFVGGWLGRSLGRTQSPAAGLHGTWPLLSLSFRFLLGKGENQLCDIHLVQFWWELNQVLPISKPGVILRISCLCENLGS